MIEFAQLRSQMVDTQLRSRGISDFRVLKAMRKVPREKFVSKETLQMAYYDNALPIGYGQTISQPYMVAKTLEVLDLQGEEKVLEIGTGSGFQAAVLAEIVKEVYSIERIPELVEFSKGNLQNSGYEKINIKLADGTQGWTEFAPFDCIVIAAAAEKVPQKLLEQLADKGKIVLPLNKGMQQILTVIEKTGNKYKEKYFDACVYVPLIGEY